MIQILIALLIALSADNPTHTVSLSDNGDPVEDCRPVRHIQPGDPSEDCRPIQHGDNP